MSPAGDISMMKASYSAPASLP